ncbi:MAG TPA: hypothetical protein VMS64_36670 [Candidatus Methylomirabilis sp.]|nr:hypothetical protein [Candidatus Methylomirabilis sp.]
MKTLALLTVGAIAGGIAAWAWGDELKRYAGIRTRDMREKAADTLHSVQGMAEDALDTTKQQVRETLQAGQDAIRPRVASS